LYILWLTQLSNPSSVNTFAISSHQYSSNVVTEVGIDILDSDEHWLKTPFDNFDIDDPVRSIEVIRVP
jgi:hypothetical protein